LLHGGLCPQISGSDLDARGMLREEWENVGMRILQGGMIWLLGIQLAKPSFIVTVWLEQIYNWLLRALLDMANQLIEGDWEGWKCRGRHVAGGEC
jgi:hypothetical protein